jgi:hypothetical protein
LFLLGISIPAPLAKPGVQLEVWAAVGSRRRIQNILLPSTNQPDFDTDPDLDSTHLQIGKPKGKVGTGDSLRSFASQAMDCRLVNNHSLHVPMPHLSPMAWAMRVSQCLTASGVGLRLHPNAPTVMSSGFDRMFVLSRVCRHVHRISVPPSPPRLMPVTRRRVWSHRFGGCTAAVPPLRSHDATAETRPVIRVPKRSGDDTVHPRDTVSGAEKGPRRRRHRRRSANPSTPRSD